MAVMVFVDFETFGMPGTPELVWQFAYGHVDTSKPKFWEHIDYFSGLIDWSDLDMRVISPSSRAFTEKYTPDAFDWVTKKKEAPYRLYSRKEFSKATIEWFQSHGCCPGGESEDWSMVGRYPQFDFHCFPKVVREHIGLSSFKCQDFSLMYAAMVPKHRLGRFPSLDDLKSATGADLHVHHDALLDIKDEIGLTVEGWKGVNSHWKRLRGTE